MRLALLIEPVDGLVDDAVEFVHVGKGAVGEVVPLEIAPAMLDGVELRRVLGQPLERQPGPLGQRLGGELAGVDGTIVEHDHQRLGALAPAIGDGEIVEQADKVGRALGGAGADQQPVTDRIEGAQQGAPLGLTRRLDPQVGAALGPTMRQVGMGARFGLVEEQQIDRAQGGLPPQARQPIAAGGDGLGILTPFQRVPRPAPSVPFCRSCTESQALPIAGPPRRRTSARSRAKVQPCSWRASSARMAVARAAAAAPTRLGRPGGVRCRSAAMPPCRNRPRHSRTVLTCTPRPTAIAAARWPAKVARIARARSASLRRAERASARKAERSCSSAVILDLPGIAAAPHGKNGETAQASAGFMNSA